MQKDSEPENPQPTPPIGSGGGGTPEPPPEPITIPPNWGTYSEPDPGIRTGIVNLDIEIKTGRD
jgi:hypothetical protein